MIDATVLLLTYYYDYEDRNHPVLGAITQKYCPAYLPFDTYLYEPLKKCFSKVILYDYLRRAAEIGHTAMNQEIIRLVHQEHPKYVIWTSFYYDVFPKTLDAIRNTGSIVIGWYFDDEWRFDRYSKYWIPHLDYNVTNSISAVSKYHALNAKCIQTIPNTGIAYKPDWSKEKFKHDVSFVGSRIYTNREQWFAEMENMGIQVHGFGPGWQHGYVPFDEMLNIFQTSKINLNFSTSGSTHALQIKGRVFQVCLAGGFLLTEYAPGLELYFNIGQEIACFTTREELEEKIRYYLIHEDERMAITRAGWERANREYTSTAMMEDVFKEIEAHENPGVAPVIIKIKEPITVRRQVAAYFMDWLLAWRKEGNTKFWLRSLNIMLFNTPDIAFLVVLLIIFSYLRKQAGIARIMVISGSKRILGRPQAGMPEKEDINTPVYSTTSPGVSSESTMVTGPGISVFAPLLLGYRRLKTLADIAMAAKNKIETAVYKRIQKTAYRLPFFLRIYRIAVNAPSAVYEKIKKIAYRMPVFLRFYRMVINTSSKVMISPWKLIFMWRIIIEFSRRTILFLNQDVKLVFKATMAFLNKDITDILQISKKYMNREIITPVGNSMPNNAIPLIPNANVTSKDQLIKHLKKDMHIMRLLTSIFSNPLLIETYLKSRSLKFLADYPALSNELERMQIAKIRSILKKNQQTIAIHFPSAAYKENVGNIAVRLRNRGFNVINIYGTISNDIYEKQPYTYYLKGLVKEIDFVDVFICVGVSEELPEKGTKVVFLHDIHDSPLGDIDYFLKLAKLHDYFIVASEHIANRMRGILSMVNPKERDYCLVKAGYIKLDRNIQHFNTLDKTKKALIYAPTITGLDFGDLISLPVYGEAIIKAMLDNFPDYEIIFRPHPHTIHTEYVKNIVGKFKSRDNFTFDNNASYYMSNYAKSALMVTDMSGTAYTYTFTTLRPVIFFSHDEAEILRRFGNSVYFTDRTKVGAIATNTDEMVAGIETLLETGEEYSEQIKQFRNSLIFNIGHAENYFVDNFKYIIENKKHPDWEYI